MPPHASTSELSPAILQATITLGLAALFGFLYRRYRKPYFLWWAVAWGVYLLRLGAIITFLSTGARVWLYWHQTVTGWTGLALLWGALVFSRQLTLRPAYFAAVLFPPLWSYIAIYRLNQFYLAAGPAVAFLSGATLWTAVVFWRYRRRTGSLGALVLAGAFLLWGLHHLDYPLLRAQGTWNPWGYYLDILFTLAVGTGTVLLVLEEIHHGLAALSALSGDLQRGGPEEDVLESLLRRPLSLRGVRGSAMYLREERGGRFVRGVGACAEWSASAPSPAVGELVERALATGRPAFSGSFHHGPALNQVSYPYAAVLPVFRREAVSGALVIVGDARDPFTALDDSFLIALGQQVGGALDHADLYRRLDARTHELERLSARMIAQHEEQRRRLSLELHDETAQVFSAVKLQLGAAREAAEPATAVRLARVLGLVDAGMQSIRNVTEALRPSLLDDLGLAPALRALVADFGDRTGLTVRCEVDETLPVLTPEAELAIFRAVQEALSNVARHAEAGAVEVTLRLTEDHLVLDVRDDGRGLPPGATDATLASAGHMGLAGMRERITALGGMLLLTSAGRQGTALRVTLPVEAHA